MTPTDTIQRRLHQAFIATVIINGIVAILDILAGFFFAYKPLVDNYLLSLAQQPGVVTTLIGLFMNMSGRVQAIGAFYFFSHGLIKLFLVWGLWKSRLWAYPVSVVFLAGFSLYQLYELALRYSTVVLAFLLFNTVVIILIIQEYRRVVAMTRLAINKAS